MQTIACCLVVGFGSGSGLWLGLVFGRLVVIQTHMNQYPELLNSSHYANLRSAERNLPRVRPPDFGHCRPSIWNSLADPDRNPKATNSAFRGC